MQGDLHAAQQWYLKSLEVQRRLGNLEVVVATLGRLCEARRDLSGAERWYGMSLRIDESLGNEPGVAKTHRQLGHVAQARQDFMTSRR
ncbi:MAG: hypothetical protein JOZ15_18220 [Acidobacteria bacterium]|nr:hypothetical protein [Acidobacteriota bacterium]